MAGRTKIHLQRQRLVHLLREPAELKVREEVVHTANGEVDSGHAERKSRVKATSQSLSRPRKARRHSLDGVPLLQVGVLKLDCDSLTSLPIGGEVDLCDAGDTYRLRLPVRDCSKGEMTVRQGQGQINETHELEERRTVELSTLARVAQQHLVYVGHARRWAAILQNRHRL